ncbi:NADH/ubiquinone/plastoquinone (complex i) [Mucilaginibacter terrenus]|uniref:Probable inorganic carbon transporter subunit DabB n=1 Tax=Mucilaginibacter terrenus TaxID=2482727 RepID=A0A3E2NWB7_9SPHI|nr:proton-conducting transporter membrane subunit [Mucilaginibacter terrenus]RFZ85305.1 NADH/ubiquinone/plastoquinone (complex i) [Mucilaginibacter terrenus]
MNGHLLNVVIVSPAMFMATAMVANRQFGASLRLIKRMSLIATTLAIITVAFIAITTTITGSAESNLFVAEGLGISLRFDPLSVIMFTMIALISFVVVKFSFNYLDGDAKQGIFIGRLSATIASVQFLVLSGNLGILLVSWVLTSVFLHRLLLFYPDRPGAIIAARKKFIIARVGDACLIIAIILLYKEFGTGNLNYISKQVKAHFAHGTLPGEVEASAVFLALAAMLKSAQFPTHGWLIEVMETPTPVSALLHAGLLNAGPFLIIRMAFIIHASTYAPLLLISIGGFTALFASAVYLTQTSIKTALSYSSVAHMGFSLLVCGLGVFPAAMLHLVAHSFYKAHAFLSSGSTIDVLRASKFESVKRTGNPVKIIIGITLALIVYTGFAGMLGVDTTKHFSLFAIGAIMVLGLSRLLTSVTDSNGSAALLLRAGFITMLISVAFFSLEALSNHLIAAEVPEIGPNTATQKLFMSILLCAFAAAVLIQILAPIIPNRNSYRSIALHIRNGLYVNSAFDRLIGSLTIYSTGKTSSGLIRGKKQ